MVLWSGRPGGISCDAVALLPQAEDKLASSLRVYTELQDESGARIGEVTDSGVAITGGLQGNERVVTTAGAFLNPGQKVIPVLQKAQ